MFDYQSIPKTCNFPESLVGYVGVPISFVAKAFEDPGHLLDPLLSSFPQGTFQHPGYTEVLKKKNMREEKVVLRNGLWPKKEVLCRKFIFQTHFFGPCEVPSGPKFGVFNQQH